MKEIKTGLYKHTKSGKECRVLGIGNHSETLEKFVVYQEQLDSKEFGPKPIWIRPVDMFSEKVEIDGEMKDRFEFVGE